MTANDTEKPVAEDQQIVGAVDEADPFGLDISFIEGTPATETVLTCTTGDTCGSSCPSACVTS
ncbi:FxLD family lanthipeptide [Streptomyces sp. NPDC000594]|uniref:FxLD family lanthipeptide n=1 Tax=Streptomyces sp. NPDC000594 TaxID=3154261 RepID=UPI00332AAB4D